MHGRGEPLDSSDLGHEAELKALSEPHRLFAVAWAS